ncbi:MAG: TIGR03663 family protein, partial [Chloroflexi bacterium]|nr:TIGR03663 family protein [Chloroflexota bacterium]
VRYLETRRPIFLYAAAVTAALALASMEAAYITFFIFGTFVLFEGIREYVNDREGPVLTALKSTSLDTWLTALSIFVVITVLLYSTFFTNPYGIWDSQHSLMDAGRKDILGGLTYWKAQHTVQRGGQPWFYYLLVLPLYEQLAVVFGIAGFVYAFVRRNLAVTFLAWWALFSLILYSWAGEKMPWLSLHIALPFILLAGYALHGVLRSQRAWLLGAAGALFAILLALEVHSMFALSFQDPANPTEMLIYVQTSQDVPNAVHEIGQIAAKTRQGTALPIGLDNTDVGGWPFIWYLRDYSNVSETATFSGPACGGSYCPVLLLLQPEYDPNSATLLKHYVVQKYRWNWWFPEDYKTWFPAHVGNLVGQGTPGAASLGTATDWQNLWNWLIYRKPFGTRGERWLYFLVRRDLVPGQQNYTSNPSSAVPQAAPPANLGASLPAKVVATSAASANLSGPRGVAAAAKGDIYVADTLNHRIVEFSPAGARIRAFGSVGSAPGQFNHQDSPQSLAVGRDGNVYAADTWNQRIEVFSPTGVFLRQWGGGGIGSGNGQFYGPRSLAVAKTGRVYVADTGNKRIQVFSSTGKFIASWGTAGSAQGQFNEPSAITLGPDGTVYVADYWNTRIQSFSADGLYIRSWSVPGWVPQSYDEPYLAVDPHTGNIFATVPAQRSVAEFSPAGRLIGSVRAGTLSLPIGVTVSGNDRVSVVDTTGNSVSTFALGVPAKSSRAPVTKGATGQSSKPLKP